MLTCRYSMFLVLLVISLEVTGKNLGVPIKAHCDFPALNGDDKLFLDLHYIADSVLEGYLEIRYFKYQNDEDSILVIKKISPKQIFRKGIRRVKLDLSKQDTNTYYYPKFYEVLKRAENIPPGAYKIFITVRTAEGIYHNTYLKNVDTVLSTTAPLRHDISKSARVRSFLSKKIIDKTQHGAGTALSNAKNKIKRVAKKRGLTNNQYEKGSKSIIDLYYEDWIAGRYEVENNSSLSQQIEREESFAGATNFNSITNNDLGHPSLFSQYKTLNKQRRNQNEVKGDIGLTTNLSTGQEQYSGSDNNWYELRGRVELPLGSLPIEVEGLYTSQDNNRKIKSSYFKVHYSVEKMKEEMANSISSYNTKFSETQSKSIGMQQIYSSAISRLEGQKANLQNQINVQKTATSTQGAGATNLSKEGLSDLKEASKEKTDNDNVAEISDDEDSSKAGKSKASKLASDAAQRKKDIESKQRQVEELDKKIDRYKTLLEQNKNTNYFDSSVAYSKTKNIDNVENLSYKQLSKRGADLLPDGKAKGFIAGITNMDAGIFSKNESKYTMGGQMMKGLDFGYDFGFCETGVTGGKTEYIGRDGELDKYTFYSGRVSVKPHKGQKLSFIYYGYTPDKTYAGNDFFKNASIATPSFFKPVHIFSANYGGAITSWLNVEGEAATSVKNSDKSDVPAIKIQDKTAYHLNAESNIPHSMVTIQASYDKTGKAFENNTLPFSMQGTEQYRIQVRNEFFKSLVSAGVEYNRLTQQNFSSQASNTKWGFDIKTNFKRYPNIALSYKPFTTFHSWTDTLNVPQRPLVGAVWTGKATYQLRRHSRSWRFMLLYNSNTTTMDTARYASSLSQATAMYADKTITATTSIGRTYFEGTNPATIITAPNKTSFVNADVSYNLTKNLTVSVGQEIARASFGLCKYGGNMGVIVHPEKLPITVRLNGRYLMYRLAEGGNWKDLYSGTIDLLYRFKIKSDKKF